MKKFFVITGCIGEDALLVDRMLPYNSIEEATYAITTCGSIIMECEYPLPQWSGMFYVKVDHDTQEEKNQLKA